MIRHYVNPGDPISDELAAALNEWRGSVDDRLDAIYDALPEPPRPTATDVIGDAIRSSVLADALEVIAHRLTDRAIRADSDGVRRVWRLEGSSYVDRDGDALYYRLVPEEGDET